MIHDAGIQDARKYRVSRIMYRASFTCIMATDCGINKSTALLPLQKVCALTACVALPVSYRQITVTLAFSGIFGKGGTGSPYVKLLVTSKGRKDELYHSCKFLNFIGSTNAATASLTMDLRCGIYKRRPYQCMGYPGIAGESPDYKISGPCLFNEYTAGSSYQKLVYKREWQAFYVIQDQTKAFLSVFPGETAQSARETLLRIKDVRKAAIAVGKKEMDCILIPIPKKDKKRPVFIRRP